jgi:cytochrome c oxidase subunit 2
MKREVAFGMLVLVILSMGISGCATSEHTQGQASKGMADVSDQELVLSGKLEEGVRVIQVTAMQYKFDPDPIVVAAGDKVRLLVTSKDVTHGLAIDEFHVNVVVDQKVSKTAEFTADKKGTFDVHCSVFCGFGHFGMHGKFIVK